MPASTPVYFDIQVTRQREDDLPFPSGPFHSPEVQPGTTVL